MSDFQIGAPVDDPPRYRGIYAEAWEAVATAPEGKNGPKWVPFNFPTVQAARRFYARAMNHHVMDLEARRRGRTTVYVRRRVRMRRSA